MKPKLFTSFQLSLLLVGISATTLLSQEELDRLGEQRSGGEVDPYLLTFDDFDVSELDNQIQEIPGAKPVSHDVDLDAAIRLTREKLKGNPDRIEDLVVYGRLLLQRARTEDHLPSYAMSLKVIEQALAKSPSFRPARIAACESMMALHRFHEALDAAEKLNSEAKASPRLLALLSDANLNLGRYREAQKHLDQLRELEESPAVLARAARLLELQGKGPAAIEVLKDAISLYEQTLDHSEGEAWYWWRLGDLQLAEGEPAASIQSFRKALTLCPNDEASLVGLARAQFSRGDLVGAEKNLRRAASGMAPPVLALLGDLLAFRGDMVAAQEFWDKAERGMREEAKVAKVAHAREFAMFFANHNRKLIEAKELADIDMNQRSDAFAWDCLAWVLFKQGQYEQASNAISVALKSAAFDSNIRFHAAEIAFATGDIQLARAQVKVIQDSRFSITHARRFSSLRSKLGIQ